MERATRTGRILVAAVLALLIPATAARAATVEVRNGELRYTAAQGERNVTEISPTQDGSQYSIYEGAASDDQKHPATLATGPGCQKDPGIVDVAHCPMAGVQHIVVSLRDLGDGLNLNGDLHVPATYSGGKGKDYFYAFAQDQKPMTISADGMADDGPFGRDNVQPDVEILNGGSFADRLVMSAHGGTINGYEGDDTMVGGHGSDTFNAAYVETVGLDSGAFYPQGTDSVTCGGGHDTVLADRTDHVDKSCEVVGRDTPQGGFLFRGSGGPDRIKPPFFWDDAIVRGGGGDDLLLTPDDYGPFKLYGGSGNDRLQGSQGKQYFSGGAGNDTIRANDGYKGFRDQVHCGPGRDRAYVDKQDLVARDCERVIVVR
ncbi:MAG: hypothetical protein QOD53_558 [Thermoleophilaceae bacterium]|nr:hypothetical protein [Thermoleophilaceae bacterium]